MLSCFHAFMFSWGGIKGELVASLGGIAQRLLSIGTGRWVGEDRTSSM